MRVESEIALMGWKGLECPWRTRYRAWSCGRRGTGVLGKGGIEEGKRSFEIRRDGCWRERGFVYWLGWNPGFDSERASEYDTSTGYEKNTGRIEYHGDD